MKTTPRPAILCTILITLFAVALSAQSPFRLEPGVRLWGAETEVAYTGLTLIDGLRTELPLGVSGAYQTMKYFRTADGSFAATGLFADQTAADAATDFPQVNLRWYAGFRQEVASTLWAELYYRGWYNLNLLDGLPSSALINESTAPDRGESLTHAFLAALRYDSVLKREVSTVHEGGRVLLTGEWAPGVLNPIGAASYLRVTLDLKTFIPLHENIDIETDEIRRNRFSLYLGLYNVTDFAAGLDPAGVFEGVPSQVRQSFGGIVTRDGLGGTVRGFEAGRFDAAFKNASSIEVRMILPTLFVEGLLPVALVYADFGIWGLPVGGGDDAESWGQVVSTGAALGIDLFGFATVFAYTRLTLSGTLLGGDTWVPFALDFGFHF